MRRMIKEADIQRTLGFAGDPEMVTARYAEPELAGLDEEGLEEKFPEYVKDISGIFVLSEGGLSAYLDKYLTYSSLPSEKEVVEAIGSSYDSAEDFLEEVAPELLNLWEEDGDRYYGLDAFLEDNGQDAGFIYQGADNTYNWSYLGPFTLNFATFEKDGMYYTVYRVHLGGDPRGNYSRDYIVEDSYEVGFLEALSGSALVTVEFNDGSEWRFYSEQDSDIWHFNMDEMPDHNTNAYQFYPLIDGLRGYEMDEKIEDLWRRWEDEK